MCGGGWTWTESVFCIARVRDNRQWINGVYFVCFRAVMPGMVLFRRRWSVGSDDLVLPALFLFLLHSIWWVRVCVCVCVCYHVMSGCSLPPHRLSQAHPSHTFLYVQARSWYESARISVCLLVTERECVSFSFVTSHIRAMTHELYFIFFLIDMFTDYIIRYIYIQAYCMLEHALECTKYCW